MGRDPNAQPELLDEEIVPPVEDIEVPADGETPPAKKEVNLDDEDASDAEFKKLDNKAYAIMRKEAADAKRERDDLKKKMKDYEKRQAPVARETPPVIDTRRREQINGVVVPETKAEWDALARQDWQSAVELKSVISARKVRDEYAQQEKSTNALNDSKTKVLDRHPELNDTNTEKSQIFLKILDKNPEYLSMAKGPILAMRDMEDEMEALGYTKEQIFDPKKANERVETTRINRGALTNGGRMPEKSARTVQLSKDDMEFCTSQGIDPKDYAREKLNLENRKGAQS